MLVLSRRKEESIIVNDNIVITVIEIRGDKVRLGIEAPREVPVHRSEVVEAIRLKEAAASQAASQAASPSSQPSSSPPLPSPLPLLEGKMLDL
ncbi:MAG: carbon storage regulator CsrA [Parcubacteria group bacterium Licking1014_1]|nr:MAG: carbon storage regulator CsrA [Parcubacteria group bacterium Licking1014_1]